MLIGTFFFHKIAKNRHAFKTISCIIPDDVLIWNPLDMEATFVSYYKDLFNYNNNCVDNGLVEDTIPHLMDNSMNAPNLPLR